ncbi:MAG: hypothetical protein LBM77_13960 [Spirochaetaceae bacterium]|jgi:hypothetical protein|nr:hypothetical protein [Spirochaetaceae bacterium]
MKHPALFLIFPLTLFSVLSCNNVFLDNWWKEDIYYSVSSLGQNGIILASPDKAREGETISLKPTPLEDYYLDFLRYAYDMNNDGDFEDDIALGHIVIIDGTSFPMPPYNVLVVARFDITVS